MIVSSVSADMCRRTVRRGADPAVATLPRQQCTHRIGSEWIRGVDRIDPMAYPINSPEIRSSPDHSSHSLHTLSTYTIESYEHIYKGWSMHHISIDEVEPNFQLCPLCLFSQLLLALRHASACVHFHRSDRVLRSDLRANDRVLIGS